MLSGSWRKAGMRTKAYVDTNIFVYATIHHPQYGNICAEVLRDVANGVFDAYGSLLVAIELLGALSRIDPVAASRAVRDYFLLTPNVLDLTEKAVKLACLTNEVVGLRYDSVHLALMLLNSVETIITNDVDDWRRAAMRIEDVKKRAELEGFELAFGKLYVVTPDTYAAWREEPRRPRGNEPADS